MKFCLPVNYLGGSFDFVSHLAMVAGLALGLHSAVAAAPRIPTQASEVLERLPMRPTDSSARELAALRADLNQAAASNPQRCTTRHPSGPALL